HLLCRMGRTSLVKTGAGDAPNAAALPSTPNTQTTATLMNRSPDQNTLVRRPVQDDQTRTDENNRRCHARNHRLSRSALTASAAEIRGFTGESLASRSSNSASVGREATCSTSRSEEHTS